MLLYIYGLFWGFFLILNKDLLNKDEDKMIEIKFVEC